VTGFFLNEKNQRRYQTTVGGRLSNVNAEKIFNLKTRCRIAATKRRAQAPALTKNSADIYGIFMHRGRFFTTFFGAGR